MPNGGGTHGKLDRRHVKKALDKSEGTTTSSGGQGHARGKHSAPTLDSGPSVDAFLRGRLAKSAVGAKASAFLNDRDQERAVSYALGDREAVVTDAVNLKDRKTVVSRVKTPLTDITVRAAEVTADGIECYNAKLRAVTVVYEGKSTFVTAYPSDFFRTT